MDSDTELELALPEEQESLSDEESVIKVERDNSQVAQTSARGNLTL